MPVDPRIGRALLAVWLLMAFGLLLPLVFGFGSGMEIGGTAEPSLRRLTRFGQNSFRLGAQAALLACIWSLPIALAAMRCHAGWKRLVLLAAATLPLFIPPSALVVAAIRLFGAGGFITEVIWGPDAVFPMGEGLGTSPLNLPGAPIYTVYGGSFVLAWSLFPIAVLALAAALYRSHGDAERAALLDTGPLGVFARISLPMASGGIAAGACLVFLFSLTNFSIPESLRGLPVLVTEVYVQFGVYYNTQRALAAALLLVGLAFVAIAVTVLAVRLLPIGGGGTADDGTTESLRMPRSLTVRMVQGAGWFCALLPIAAAVFVLVRTSSGPRGFLPVWRATWATASDEFFFTIIIGGITAAASVLLGTILGASLASLRKPLLFRLLIAVPIVIPGPVYGIAVVILLRRPPGSLPMGLDDLLAELSRTTIPLMCVWCLRFVPIVALIVESLLRGVSREEREAALLDGAGLIARWRVMFLPAAWPGLAVGALIVFALSLGEEGAAVLLLPPGPTTLGVRLLTLMHFAPTGQVSALSLLMIGPGIVAYLAAIAMLPLMKRQ